MQPSLSDLSINSKSPNTQPHVPQDINWQHLAKLGDFSRSLNVSICVWALLYYVYIIYAVSSKSCSKWRRDLRQWYLPVIVEIQRTSELQVILQKAAFRIGCSQKANGFGFFLCLVGDPDKAVVVSRGCRSLSLLVNLLMEKSKLKH